MHHTRGQLHRKRRGGSQPEISSAGYLLIRPRNNDLKFKMAAMAIYDKKTFKRLLLQNCWTHLADFLQEAYGASP